MILGEVEETVSYYEVDDETYEEMLKVRHVMSKKITFQSSSLELTNKPPFDHHHLNVLKKKKKNETRTIPFLFVRGDVVILISPSLRQ